MEVDDLLSSTPLPDVSVDSEGALSETLRRGRTRRRRRTVGLQVSAVLMVVLAAATMSLGGDVESDRVSTGPTSQADQEAGSWRRIAASGLSARDQGVAAWTGAEVVIVGGSSTTPCSADADCLVDLEPLADGAAYNPAADSWRLIPDAPAPILSGSATWTGSEVLVLAERPGAPDVLLAYDPSADVWAQRADPPQSGLGTMTWTGESWVGITPHGGSDQPGWRYRPHTDAWEALPTDPLGAPSDRVLVSSGGDLVLLGSRSVEDGPTPNGLWEAAVMSSDGVWRHLPSSAIDNNGGTWSAIDGLVVNPGNGSSGTFDNGGILDPEGGEWSPLPSGGDVYSGNRTGYSGAAGRWIVDDDRLLDPVRGEWHGIEDRHDDVAPAVAAWTGTEILTWGGTIERGLRPELVATGLAYTPPAVAPDTEPEDREEEAPTLLPPSTATAGSTDVAFVLLGKLSSSQVPGSMAYAGVDRALADQWGVFEAGPPPTVDFDRQIVLIFTTTQEDGCQEQFVALSRDGDTSVRPMFSAPPVADECPADQRATHSYFVAVERADLPSRFTLVLAAAADSSYPEQHLEVDLSSNFASSTPPLPAENTPEPEDPPADNTPEPEDLPGAEDPPGTQDPPVGDGSDLEAPEPGREITFDGAGDVRLDQALDSSSVTPSEGGGSCGYWGPGEPSHNGTDALRGLVTGADSGAPKVLSIMIRNNGTYRTASGVGIGTTLDSLRRIYGDRLVIDRADGWETPTDGLLASYTDVAAVRYGDAALTFSLSGDVVDTVKVSHADFWGDDEGCA